MPVPVPAAGTTVIVFGSRFSVEVPAEAAIEAEIV